MEIGQIASHIKQILPAKEVVEEMVEQYNRTVERLSRLAINYQTDSPQLTH